jgi:5-formyltetrahydrofolate cyclo-ligase
MVTSRFGVREPQGPAVDESLIDLVVVPGLAFTPAGARLGYGGGFYDRFLPLVSAPHVGVCFAEQVLDDLPVEPHDIRVQHVVSA